MSDVVNTLAGIQIEEWRPGPSDVASLQRDVDMLGEILHAIVHDGAGVSFIVPFSLDDGRAFWQLDLAVPPNQRHRAEVLKLLVHPTVRRCGIARALMVELEAVAESEGRTLLTLDTWSGSAAELLYRSLGYVTVGVIPRYARGSLTPELEPATIMYKELTSYNEPARV